MAYLIRLCFAVLLPQALLIVEGGAFAFHNVNFVYLHGTHILCAYSLSANWAQLAGQRAQNTATPYIPDQWHRDPSTSLRPMWSARWGHAVVVLNQSTARSYLTEEENSARLRDDNPVLVLLGGDDGLPRDSRNLTMGELLIESSAALLVFPSAALISCTCVAYCASFRNGHRLRQIAKRCLDWSTDVWLTKLVASRRSILSGRRRL